MLVAEDTKNGDIIGTASVVFDVSTYSDLVGEFGRLSVHPDYRKRGIGKLLLEKRLQHVQDRLHLGIVSTRVVHPFAQHIAFGHQFVPVGFTPLKHFFSHRESFALFARYFGEALTLRKNNPRVIPEVYHLACQVFDNLSLSCDVVVNEDAESYPHDNRFTLEELTAKGLPGLLHIERGRVRRKEIFGHMRLEYGFFKLSLGKATYLTAFIDNHIAGAIGFTIDHVEHIARVFELISLDNQVIWFLLSSLEQKCSKEWNIFYIEIDVSAHATRMQRTLVELDFLPVAYVPAMVFHDVERLDIIKMVRLSELQDLGALDLIPSTKKIADIVMKGFINRKVTPKIAKVASSAALFKGLSEEQLVRLAGACVLKEYQENEIIFSKGDVDNTLYIILEGAVNISVGRPEVQVGKVTDGETLGEMSLLNAGPHSATAMAETRVEASLLTHDGISELIKRRPDIGVFIYKNLAAGLGKKLISCDLSLRGLLIEEKSD